MKSVGTLALIHAQVIHHQDRRIPRLRETFKVLARKSKNVTVSVSAAIAVLAAFIATSAAFGQSTFGSIRGTVQDVSGAVVPRASIDIYSLDDNSERQTATND